MFYKSSQSTFLPLLSPYKTNCGKDNRDFKKYVQIVLIQTFHLHIENYRNSAFRKKS